jgi:CubicO group peptidase (beta-lactamase class C family)
MRSIAIATLLLWATSPARAAVLRPPESLDELKARIARVLADDGVPGAGLALVTRDRVLWAGGVGLADRATGRPVSADTLFRVGSITKSFVALALVKLSEEGRIDLAARVSDLAPELRIENRWAADAPIKVAHLLEHTAGFDDMHFNELYAPISVENMPLAEILARNPRSRVARWRPGSRFSYANPGYTVAAYLIEKASGRRWFDYITDELLRPLGMTGAALRWTPEVDARLARGYDDGPEAIPYRGIYHHPAGNLMASPRELAALIQLWLSRGRVGGRQLVSVAGLERTERAETATVRGTDIDYGLGNYGDTRPRARSRGHDGGIEGFLSSAHYMPDCGVGYVVLINSTGSRAIRASQEIGRLVTDYLVRKAPPPPPRVDVPAAELARWQGDYHFANPRLQLVAFIVRLLPALRLTVHEGRLFLHDPNRSLREELIPLGSGRFRFAGQSGSHFMVGHDAEGRRVLVGDGAYLVEEPAWMTPLFGYGARAVWWLLLSVLALPIAALVWRRRAAPLGWGWPMLSTVSFIATPILFVSAAMAHRLGECNAYTVGICAATIAFPVGALGALSVAVRRLGQPLPVIVRLHRLAIALAASSAAVYFAWYGLVGIRLWRY